MGNNQMQLYKESIFSKISKFFKKLIHKGKENKIQPVFNESIIEVPKNQFITNLKIEENEEEKRLRILQEKYENGEICDDEISLEDMDKLIERYKKETEKINTDTEKIRIHISKMLNDLKAT